MKYLHSLLILLLCSFLSSSLFANEELSLYTKQKYNLDYQKQDANTQAKLTQEYKDLSHLSNILTEKLKNNQKFNVLQKMLALQIFKEEFIANYHPTKEELEKIYAQSNFSIEPKYKLRTIKVQYNKSADIIMDILNDSKENRLSTFEKLVHKYSIDIKSKNNKGLLGLFRLKELEPNVQKALVNAKQNDILKVYMEDEGWYIIYVETYEPSKTATFEQAKEALVQLAQKEALAKEIQKYLKP